MESEVQVPTAASHRVTWVSDHLSGHLLLRTNYLQAPRLKASASISASVGHLGGAPQGLVFGTGTRYQPETRSHPKLRLGQDGFPALWWSALCPDAPRACCILLLGGRGVGGHGVGRPEGRDLWDSLVGCPLPCPLKLSVLTRVKRTASPLNGEEGGAVGAQEGSGPYGSSSAPSSGDPESLNWGLPVTLLSQMWGRRTELCNHGLTSQAITR